MMAAVLPLEPADSFDGTIATPGAVESFQITIPTSGRLTAGVRVGSGSALDTRLSLLGPDGELLVESDGQSAAEPGGQITQHVLAGTYVVEVTGLGSATGSYTLTTDFQQATAPDQPLLVNFNRASPWNLSPLFSTTGDFNGDGRLDIATSDTVTNDVSVLLGLGDGTFQSASQVATGLGPTGIVAGDFNGDGRLDLAVANSGSNDVSLLLGNRDGTFQSEKRFARGTGAQSLAVADLTGDGRLDLIIVDVSNEVSVLPGNRDGTFGPEKRYAVGGSPRYAVVGDFSGDGHLDLAVSNFDSNDVSLLRGNGDGTFQPQVRITTGTNPGAIVAGDFNGDGKLDLATANSGSNDVSVLLGSGQGTFPGAVRYAAGTTPFGLVAGDFNGDGRLDLVAANQYSDDVSVLLGKGDGAFLDQARYQAGSQPVFVVSADFNGDGRLDLATNNVRSHDVSMLLGLGNGTFQPDPANPRPGQTNPLGMLVGDFNHDRIPDLATVSYTGGNLFVFLARGDGTFQERERYAVGAAAVALVSADVNGDGIADLITGNCFSSNVSVLLGNQDGTFKLEATYPASHFVQWVVAGDFNGDGRLDLATGGDLNNNLAVLLGRPDGTFGAPMTFGSARGPAAVGADFNGDGYLDLAIANPGANAVAFLPGRGDGTFQDPVVLPVGKKPVGLVAADFNGDHTLDLAVTNSGSNDISLLLGRGRGTFGPAVRYAVGVAPDSIVAADLDGDGRLDLAVTNGGSTYASVLRGRGDGTFDPPTQATVTDTPSIHRGLAAADLDGDGRLDLATAQLGPSDVSVLLGNGDGTFQAPLRFAVGLGPVAAVSGDFSNSGRRDVASVNPSTNEVAVALGAGDGTLGPAVFYPVGATPVAIVTGDLNGDGRPDLTVANFASNSVSVLLGFGDGRFQPEQRYAVGANPTGIAAGDFDGDGTLDLAVSNAGSNDVSLLFGRGDGSFRPQVRLATGLGSQALVAGDFDGDGILDLAIADYRSASEGERGEGDVAVFLGRGDGTFEASVRYALGTAPVGLITGYFNGDGVLDLATANFRSNDVSVLLGRGDGTFQAPLRYEAGNNPLALASGDFNGDLRTDLAVADSTGNAVALLFGRGDGTFNAPARRPVAAYPRALLSDDFNNDSRTDLAVATQFSRDVSLLMGLGTGTFLSPDTISNEIHATPLVADADGDGTPDVAVINRAGQVLLRHGRPGEPGTFAPPVVLNPDPQFAVRELALVRTGGGLILAALDARDSALSFYSRAPGGTFTGVAGPTVPGILPVRLASGDLNGDGRDDLVVAATGTNEVFVYLQQEAGDFGSSPDYQVGVGVNPSAIRVADTDGDGRLDIVVTNQFSGDVSVLPNDPARPFCPELRFRGGVGLYWMEQRDGSPVIHSFQGSAGVVRGRFDEGETTDLIVANSGSGSFSLLRGTGSGGFFNPQAAQTFAAGVRPIGVVAGDFNHDGNLDAAILNEGSQDLAVFLGDGHGGFTEKTITGPDGRPTRLSAGNAPTGVALADSNGDGESDLLVGNAFGDVLVLLGKGDGTFQPYQRADRHVALAVADLAGDGRKSFIFANAGMDRVTVQYPQPSQTFTQDRSDGLRAPGAVAVTDLNADGIPDLVVANSGSNNVLVYLGQGDGRFAPARSFFAGTNPTGVSVAFLQDDLVPDPADPSRLIDRTPDLVVANEGSNDVTILLGQGQGAGWTLAPGPRLRAGAGPVSTTVGDATGDGVPDIVVANSQSNTVSVLPGVGLGFFNDQHPLVFDTGQGPEQALVGDFTGDGRLDLVSVNAGSNDLTFFRDFGPGVRIATGGDTPVAALAGDFNGDGSSDLLIAHNGDGHVTLLTGGPDGPELAASFARADMPHPTDLALVSHGDESDIYVTGEGQELALLLTTLGVAIPVLVVPEPALTSVFVVNGPGIEQGIDIAALPAAGAALPGTLLANAEGRGDSALAPGESIEATAVAQAAVAAGPGSAVAVATASSGSGPDGNPPVEDTPSAEGPPNGFQMDLDEAFRRRRSGAADLLAAVDQVFIDCQDSTAGLTANDSAELTGAAMGRIPLALSELPRGEVDAGLGNAGVGAASGWDAVRGSLPDSRDAVRLAESPVARRGSLPEAEAAPAWPALAAAVLFLAGAHHGDPRRNGDATGTPAHRGQGRPGGQ
jgi:hypothetical protein